MKILETNRPVSKQPWHWPPFWFLLAILSQFGIAWFDPGALPTGGWLQPVAGYLLLATGIVMVLASSRCFVRHGTCIIPFQKPTKLIQDGLYRFSRNPLYLGEVVMLIGLTLLFGSLWTLLPIAIFALLVTVLFILPEERLLKEEFGQEYESYRRRVRRWI